MKRKILIITAMLAVMVAMTGTAMAYVAISPDNIVINLDTDAPVSIKTEWYPGTILTLDTMQIRVYKDLNKNGQVDTGESISDDLEVQLDAEGYTSSYPVIYNPMNWDGYIASTASPSGSSSKKYTESLSVRDANNGATTADNYVIAFDAGNGIAATYPISTSTAVSAIPEFPTVALPIAAVIGLVFFFQQKKNKKE